MPAATEVREMFGRIAPRYDLLNRVLSAGIDRRWRKKLLRLAGPVAGRTVVDACCGTGDLAFVFARAGARVVGVDFTLPMLVRAADKSAHATSGASAGDALFAHGDALALPVANACADFATVAFGIRNVADRGAGLRELARVVRPGGRVIVLEFSMPRGRALRGLYQLYFTRVLPAIGGAISGDAAAYRYLPDTVLEWPTPDAFQREMEEVGLEQCGYSLLSGGIACLSWGSVPTS